MHRKIKFDMLAMFGILILIAPQVSAQGGPPFDVEEVLAQADPLKQRRSPLEGRAALLNARRATTEQDTDFGPSPCKKREGKFTLIKMDKIKVADIVEYISQLTCKNFILSNNSIGNKTITVYSHSPVTVDEAWKIFLSALEVNNFTVSMAGEFYKISEKKDAAKENIPFFTDGQRIPESDAMVTVLYDVKGMPISQVKTLISGLTGTASRGAAAPVELDSHILFSETAYNVNRILKILEKVDVPGAATSVHIYELSYAKADEVKEQLDDILGGEASSTQTNARFNPSFRSNQNRFQATAETSRQKIIADDRTNKLIVIASDKTYERIKDLLNLLDVEASNASSQGQIFVYKLKNADSEDLSKTLSELIQGKTPTPATTNRGRPATFTPVDSEALFEGDIKITNDKSTNSLVVVASPRDYKTVRAVIEKLDLPRLQVFVEAAILDISVSDTENLGLGVYGGAEIPLPGLPAGGLGLFGNPKGMGVAREVANAAAPFIAAGNSAAAAAAAIPSFLKGTFGLMGLSSIPLAGGNSVDVPSVGALIEAFKSSSDVDILSTPSIMTLDNEKAKIEVGERVPVAQFTSNIGSGTTTGGSLSVPSITYEDVKLKFEIEPHVNTEENTVKLKITQNVTERGEKISVVPNLDPQFSFRTKFAETTVVAKDQQNVMIAGLISNETINTENKVPLLGDIPILGYLFKNTQQEKKKKNLVLILTPYIIRSDLDIKRIHDRKLKEREDFAKLYFGNEVSQYNPEIDYSKKSGPLAQILHEVGYEMMRVENGGPGLPGEVIIGPKKAEKKSHKIELSVPLGAPPSDIPTLQPAVPRSSTPITRDIDDGGNNIVPNRNPASNSGIIPQRPLEQ